MYGKLHDCITLQLSRDLQSVKEIRKFIELLIEEGIQFLKRSTEVVCSELDAKGFQRRDGTFTHLLDIKAKAFTADNLATLQNKIENMEEQIKSHLATDKFDLWAADIEAIRVHVPRGMAEDIPDKSPKEQKFARKKKVCRK